jgi:uncharacterized protein YjbI with pentapeptide repeats
MANTEHVALLRQGVEVWNAWREENPDIVPDLSMTSALGIALGLAVGAHLARANLRGADLIGTNLRGTDLSEANLRSYGAAATSTLV